MEAFYVNFKALYERLKFEVFKIKFLLKTIFNKIFK
jgi:hypothetical protein